ncbi:MAG: SDR family oxidoreductase [Kofleriaceae bacterium]
MAKTMRVFVTGATGWIGTPTVKALKAAGHHVIGLAYSDAGADKLKGWGVDVHRGDIKDPKTLGDGVRAADATIHLAFAHDVMMKEGDIAKANQIDRDAITAMLEAGRGKPFIGTNGTLQVSQPGRVAVETDQAPPNSPLSVRSQAEKLVRDAGGSVVRLPPTVHGKGDFGFIKMFIDIAKQKQVSAYIGDGANHWPAVHHADAATLYRLAVEAAPPGSALHGNAEEGVTTKAIAETIAKGLGVPLKSMSHEEAVAHFGFLGHVFALDNRASSAWTRDKLGWKPSEVGLLDDMRTNYF